MYDTKIPHRQLSAWLLAGIIPTAIQLTAGASWFSVLLVTVLCLLCIWLRWVLGAEPQGKLTALFQLGLLVLLLGTAAQASVQSWPIGAHPAVGTVLLILAAWSALKGTDAAARVGCVLFWFVLILYLVLLGAGMKAVQVEWLMPTTGEVNAFGCVLLLTPAAAAMHQADKKAFPSRLWLMGIICTVAATVTAGVLSPMTAGQKSNAFYEMTRSLNLLGQARRFEAVLSAGMTVGWFSVCSIYLTLCAKMFEKLSPGNGKRGILVGGISALAILLCELHIPGVILLVLCAIFWVLIPILTQWVEPEKKSKKSENSA